MRQISIHIWSFIENLSFRSLSFFRNPFIRDLSGVPLKKVFQITFNRYLVC
jgi:hypothetical protein